MVSTVDRMNMGKTRVNILGGIKAWGKVLSLRFTGIAHIQFTARMSDILKNGLMHHQCSGGFCALPALFGRRLFGRRLGSLRTPRLLPISPQ